MECDNTSLINTRWLSHKEEKDKTLLEDIWGDINTFKVINFALLHLVEIRRFSGCLTMPEELRDDDRNHSIGVAILIEEALRKVNPEIINQESGKFLREIKIASLLHDVGEALGEMETVYDVLSGRKIPKKDEIESDIMRSILYLSCFPEERQEEIQNKVREIQISVDIETQEINKQLKSGNICNDRYVELKTEIYQTAATSLHEVGIELDLSLDKRQKVVFEEVFEITKRGESKGNSLNSVLKMADTIEGTGHLLTSMDEKNKREFDFESSIERLRNRRKELSNPIANSTSEIDTELFDALSEILEGLIVFQTKLLKTPKFICPDNTSPEVYSDSSTGTMEELTSKEDEKSQSRFTRQVRQKRAIDSGILVD